MLIISLFTELSQKVHVESQQSNIMQNSKTYVIFLIFNDNFADFERGDLKVHIDNNSVGDTILILLSYLICW